jgi:hypothetical protein
MLVIRERQVTGGNSRNPSGRKVLHVKGYQVWEYETFKRIPKTQVAAA